MEHTGICLFICSAEVTYSFKLFLLGVEREPILSIVNHQPYPLKTSTEILTGLQFASDVGQRGMGTLRHALQGMTLETNGLKHTFSRQEIMPPVMVPIKHSYEPNVKLYHYRLKFTFSIKLSVTSGKKGGKGRCHQSITHPHTEDITFSIRSLYHFTCKSKVAPLLTLSQAQAELTEAGENTFNEKMSRILTVPRVLDILD